MHRMNIFVLDWDPLKAAEYHCNKHVVKMVLESGQMLCTAHWVGHLYSRGRTLDSFDRVKDAQAWVAESVPARHLPPWKMSHVNHPCSVWTRASLGNYRWHSELGLALCAEYTKRYGKVHKAQAVHEWLATHTPPAWGTLSRNLLPWPICVPDDCQGFDAIQSYRDYYNRHKSHFAVWEPRAATPKWYQGSDQA